MKKTAVFILNYNLPDETNKLYELLKPYEKDDYRLFVLENGSTPAGKSKYSTYSVNENLYHGGGYDAAMLIAMKDDEFDSLLVISNDIILYPEGFVRTLRSEMFFSNGEINYDIVSPCIYNLNSPINLPTMFNFGSASTRNVPLVDFSCALVSRRLLKESKNMDNNLYCGGFDTLFCFNARKNNWKIGVMDRLFVVHDDSLTIRKANTLFTKKQYLDAAVVGEESFYIKENIRQEFFITKYLAKNYTYNQKNEQYILFNMHIMWYESAMINDTLDSISKAIDLANIKIKLKFCLNSQTYIEKPTSGSATDMFDMFKDHPLMKQAEVVYKTDANSFYNIGDWRREAYDSNAKYTVWGESDCIMPSLFFMALESINKEEKHVVTFASRKMYGDDWKNVEHEYIRKYSHGDGTLKFLSKPLLTWEMIDQTTLDNFNQAFLSNDGTFYLEQKDAAPREGSLICISGKFDEDFIPKDLHFAREDTCFEKYCTIKNVPHFSFSRILKGHNYSNPRKRTNTNNTREDEAYKKYERESYEATDRFINKLKNS